MAYLNARQLSAARRWLPVYQEAERRIGVPWALLAALHYRENDFGAVAGLPGGVMQHDPPLPLAVVRTYGLRYSIGDLKDPETDPRSSILCAAAFVQDKMAGAKVAFLTPGATERHCALAAFLYNGTGYGTLERSPYVSNDPQRGVQLWIRGTLPGKGGTRVRVNQPDTRPGVLAVMRELRARLTAPRAVPAAPPFPVLMPDRAGAFTPQPGARWMLPTATVVAWSGVRLFIRPARPDELPGGNP